MTPTLAIGIDIGGTNTSFGVVSREGQLLEKQKIATTGHADLNAYIAQLAGGIAPMIAQYGQEHFAGVGIGAPSGNIHTGEIIYSPNLPWKGIIPMAQIIGNALGMNTLLTNDAKAATIGEMIYGNARGMNDFIMLTLGTGLGSGFVSNGRIIYGHDGLAGELGHVIAVRNGRLCGCGRRGCLETYASATGIVRTAREWLAKGRLDTCLAQHDGPLTARAIQDAAQGGDQFALDLYEFTGRILGRALADAVAITSPQAIIFFGGLSHGGPLIIEPVRRHMEKNLLRSYQGKVQLLRSALPDADAALLGASALVW